MLSKITRSYLSDCLEKRVSIIAPYLSTVNEIFFKVIKFKSIYISKSFFLEYSLKSFTSNEYISFLENAKILTVTDKQASTEYMNNIL